MKNVAEFYRTQDDLGQNKIAPVLSRDRQGCILLRDSYRHLLLGRPPPAAKNHTRVHATACFPTTTSRILVDTCQKCTADTTTVHGYLIHDGAASMKDHHTGYPRSNGYFSSEPPYFHVGVLSLNKDKNASGVKKRKSTKCVIHTNHTSTDLKATSTTDISHLATPLIRSASPCPYP